MTSASSPVVKRWSRRFLAAMTISAVGLIVGSLVITSPPAATQSAAPVTEHQASLQRGIDAGAARYSTMPQYYAAPGE